MRLSLVPRTSEFYDLFTAAGENALEAARLVDARFRAFPEREVRQAQIKELENKGDDLTRQIIELLNTQYITPFDREDIYELAKAIDDVVDFIENASEMLTLYKVERPMEQSLEQCRLLVEATEHLSKALGELRGLRNAERHLVKRQGARRRGGQPSSGGDRRPLREPCGSRRGDPLEGHLRGARGCDRRLRDCGRRRRQHRRQEPLGGLA